jgi:transcriptional regulator with XRE-family HTH domain
MALEIEPSGQFGNALAAALRDRGVGLRELAVKTEGTYEHMRKLVKGLAYPSTYLLKEIAKVLHFDVEEMERLIHRDKMQAQFGSTLNSMLKRHPRMSEYDTLIPLLTDEQNDAILAQIRAVVKMAKPAKRGR